MFLHHLHQIFLIAISSNLDNIGVGASFGMRQISLPWRSNLLIALITATGTFFSMWLGDSVHLYLDEKVAAVVGAIFIIFAGFWVAYQSKAIHKFIIWFKEFFLRNHLNDGENIIKPLLVLEDPISTDRDLSCSIELKEAVSLALGLSINNIPNGIGAGALGLNIYLMTLAVFVASVITILSGVKMGRLGVSAIGETSELMAGAILVIVGIFELIS